MIAPGAARCTLRTPAVGAGGLAVVQLTGDVEAVCTAIGMRTVPVGSWALRDVAGVEHGVVARIDDDLALLMPHGGKAVVHALLAALQAVGVEETRDIAVRPESRDPLEALMLDALSSVVSPRAIDHLLMQPSRWRSWDAKTHPREEIERISTTLDRLLHPPTVAAVGASNIGKSTLLNALAREQVAIVADEPGATRDHLGVALELDGMAIRWLDTPGIRKTEDPLEQEAVAEAMQAVQKEADLVLCCGDPSTPPPDPATLGLACPTIRVQLRSDLSPSGFSSELHGKVRESSSAQIVWGTQAECSTALANGAQEGLETLATQVREQLLPDAILAWQGPWAFAKGVWRVANDCRNDRGAVL